MKNRFRVEIYDDIKQNDVTIYSDQGIDKEHLIELVFSNLSNFQGEIRAYVYDLAKAKKTAALFIPYDIVTHVKNKFKSVNLTGSVR